MPDVFSINHDILRQLEKRAASENISVDDLLTRWLEHPPTKSKSIKHSTNFYELLLNSVGQAVIATSMDGEITYWNSAAEKIYGWTKDEVLGKPVIEVTVPQMSKQQAKDIMDNLLQGKIWEGEFLVQHKDGTPFWVHVVDHPILSPSGELTGIIGISHNIMERKKNHELLRESEARYRAIIENFPNGLIALYDKDLRYTVVNGQGLAQIGMKPDDLNGKRLRDVFPPEIYERDEPALLAALNGKATESIVNFAGHDFQVQTVPVRDNDQTIIGGMVVSQNITPLRQAESRLKELVNQHELAIKTAKLGIWHLDMATGDLIWNDELHNIYGISKEELAQNIDGWRKCIHPEDYEYANQRFEEIASNGYVDNVQFRIIRSDGSLRHINASGVSITDPDGNIKKLIGVNIDVTDYETTRQNLLASETRLTSLLESQTTYVIRTDLDGNYTYANPSFIKQFLSPDQAESYIGLSSLNTIQPDDHQKTREAVSNCIENPGQSYQVILRKPDNNGDIIWTLWEFVGITDKVNQLSEIQCVGISINKLKQAEDALRRYEHIVAHATDGISIVGSDYHYILVNDAYIKYTGRKREEIEGQHVADTFVGWDNFNKYIKGYIDRSLAGENIRYSEWFKFGDNRYFFEITYAPYRNIDGEITGIMINARDITQRYETNKALNESEIRYRTLFNGSLNPTLVYDENANIVMLNEVAARNLQKSPQEAINTNIGEYFPEMRDITIQRIKQVLESQEILYVEDKLEFTGGEHWFWTVIQPVPSHDEHMRHVLFISHDMTKQKQSELARQESEARHRATIEASLDSICVMDTIRNEQGDITDFRIVEVNERFVERLNLPREKLVGNAINDLFPKDREHNFFEQYKQVVETGKPLDQEFQIQTGTTVPGWYQHQVVKVGDGVAIITRDITDKKHGEELTLEHERMKAQFNKERERNTLIQHIISALSHDLRTPLTVIATSRELLSKYYDRLTEEKRLEKLNTIDHQIQYALNLLDDTVAMARGDLDESKFNPLPTNLDTLCQVSIDELSSTIDSHHLEYHNVGQVETVHVDETLVNRILLNLLSNAIKYSPTDSLIRLELDQEPGSVILRVIDNGIGIRNEDITNIFDPFFRTREAQTIHGTGLGLSIVKDCVDRHHGIIEVESEMGVGTTFTVKLPTNVDPEIK